MVAFDFPASPTNGQTYSLNGVVFTYNGYGWVQQGNSGGVNTAYVDSQDALRVLKAGDTMTGALHIVPASGNAQLWLDSPTGAVPVIIGQRGTLVQWIAYFGNGAGGDFSLQRYNDAQSAIDYPLVISRSTGGITANSPTPSTSPTTGALTVAGGVGIGGSIFAGGLIAASGDIYTTRAHPQIHLSTNSVASGERNIIGETNGVPRWTIQLGNAAAEGGSNTGSDFFIRRWADDGAYLGDAMSIIRANNLITFAGNTTIPVGTVSTSPVTGALTVAGGVGIGGVLYVQGNITMLGARMVLIDDAGLTWGAQTTALLGNSVTNTVDVYTANGLAFRVGPTTIQIARTTASTSPTSGALVVGGGVGIGGVLSVGGAIVSSVAMGSPQIDALGQTQVLIATGSSAIIAGGGGFIAFVSNLNQGNNAIYLLDNAAASLLVSGQGVWVAPTTTPAALMCSVQWDGVANFRIYSNRGGSENFRAFVMKLR